MWVFMAGQMIVGVEGESARRSDVYDDSAQTNSERLGKVLPSYRIVPLQFSRAYPLSKVRR